MCLAERQAGETQGSTFSEVGRRCRLIAFHAPPVTLLLLVDFFGERDHQRPPIAAGGCRGNCRTRPRWTTFGRQGEDPPSDVDGDGLVTWMRIPDPAGEWMADPADPRASIRADKKLGQAGLWNLVREGRDSDGDEEASEDAEHDAVVNRNFPNGWKEHAPESGLFATDEPEARDLCQFVLDHKDIALVLTYGAQDNLVEKPKTSGYGSARTKRLPADGTLDADGDMYAEIGKRYKKITGSKAKGENDARGSFQAWCELQRGLWCLNIAGWTMPCGGRQASDRS